MTSNSVDEFLLKFDGQWQADRKPALALLTAAATNDLTPLESVYHLDFLSLGLDVKGSALDRTVLYGMLAFVRGHASNSGIKKKVHPVDVCVKRRRVWTVDEWLTYLRSIGLDVDELMRLAELNADYFLSDQQRALKNARRMLDLLVSQPNISKEQVHALIDDWSIYDFVGVVLESSKSMRARINAFRRHREHNILKSEAFTWLDSDAAKAVRTLDDKATAITKRMPIKFRAARVWVRDWKKERSASK